MPSRIDIETFLYLKKDFVSIDVRSEGEFNQAHIPGAINIPLLNNTARKIVGITYKNKGHLEAVKAGFDLVGHEFGRMLDNYNKVTGNRAAIFYCWRGGLRSNIAANIFEWGGKKPGIIHGGYKSYRNSVLKGFSEAQNIRLLSGFTGVGKTEILRLLHKHGEQILDIEALANHKGSVLGGLGMPPQSTQEMFENKLFEAWKNLDVYRPVYIENESRKIGANVIPEAIWNQMLQAPVIDIELSFDERLDRILDEYGRFDVQTLAACTEKIQKRLGGDNLKLALQALSENKIKNWAVILMKYYDKTYLHSRTDKKKSECKFEWDWRDPETSVIRFLNETEVMKISNAANDCSNS